MKLLITGGAGFIGSNFIRYWLNKYSSDYIYNLDKLTYAGNIKNLEDIKHNKNYKFIKSDITNADVLDDVLPRVDIVVNFAAESHVDNSITGPKIFFETNVLGTQILLDYCIKHKIKHFHHISTDEVFGELPLNSNKKFNENTNYNPRSPYSASKASSDFLIRSYSNTYGLKYTITNCSNNFGPYQHPEKLIPLFITNLIQNKKVSVYGKGNQIRDWLYVEDHCRAIDLVIMSNKKNQTYCIGGSTKEITNLDITKKLIKLLGKDESYIDYVEDRPGHDKKYAVDWSKAKKELGYKPLYKLDEYLEKTVNWYIENKKWWKNLV